jgi:hypothetical protein
LTSELVDYAQQMQKVNPQNRVNTTGETYPFHSQQRKENIVVKSIERRDNTKQFQQSPSQLGHKEISDKEERSQNASEDQSEDSKSEQQQQQQPQQQAVTTQQTPEVRLTQQSSFFHVSFFSFILSVLIVLLSVKKRAARQTTARGFVREGRSSRGRKIKYRFYGQVVSVSLSLSLCYNIAVFRS